jgi:hypothetical protein
MMLSDPLHNAGADGRCEACGEPFPCPTGIAIYETVKRALTTYEAVKRALESPPTPPLTVLVNRPRGRAVPPQPRRMTATEAGGARPDCPECHANTHVWGVAGRPGYWGCFKQPPHRPPLTWRDPD